jgi:hypothetical protein
MYKSYYYLKKKGGTPNDIETNFSALNHRHPSTGDSLGKTLKCELGTLNCIGYTRKLGVESFNFDTYCSWPLPYSAAGLSF